MQSTPAEGALQIEGTPYYRTLDGQLRRAIRARLPVQHTGSITAEVVVGGVVSTGIYECEDGVALIDGSPTSTEPQQVEVRVACSAGSWSGRATLDASRLWTIYVAQDKHLDYGWIHPVEDVAERMNDLVDYHLRASERLGLRWNLGVSIWVEEYLRARPAWRGEQLLSALRSRSFEVAAFWIVPYPGLMDTEEVIQCLDYARHLEDAFGIPVETASLQEVPSLPWGYATILAGAGIPYLAKGAYDLRNPHLKERDALPLATWEGPDGSSVLLKWDLYDGTHSWGGYAEAYNLWRAELDEDRVRFVEDTIARYEGYESYPVDAVLLDGVGMDEYPQTEIVTEFIQSFNARGWEYPRLVDANWSDFWQAVEAQIGGNRVSVPVVQGDWGTTWEEWPAQLARLSTIYRRGRETVLAAQALTGLSDRLDPAGHVGRASALAEAWRGLLQFADHNIGGIDADTTADMRDRKGMYVYAAAREGTRALQASSATIAGAVAASDAGRRLLVANPSSWQRSGIVEVMVPAAGPFEVTDVQSGKAVPREVETRGGWPEHYLSFVASGVPSFGYRCYDISTGSGMRASSGPDPSDGVIENESYRLSLDERTGGLRSLWDKVAERELVTQGSEATLNEYLHHSDGILHRPAADSIVAQHSPLGSTLKVEVSSLRAKLRTTYRLYHDVQRVDIVNDLTKEPSSEPQCSWFAFPLNIAGHYVYDGPAAILRAGLQADGGDLLPGAGRTCVAARSFLAAVRSEYGVVLASPDAYLFQFGSGVLADPLADSDFSHPLVLSLAMHNFTRNDRAVDQGGHRTFQFRYSLTGAQGPFSGSAAVRFAKEVAQELPAAWAAGRVGAPLPSACHEFLSVTPNTVVATGLKATQDGDGWVLRLWECEGRATEVTVDAGHMDAKSAWSCDLLERRGDPLVVERGLIRLDLPARGLRAIRFARG